ncbi:uncharacterized protein PV07_08731 [Cladophialophora immunda]|uniref:Uncharacterized protein n=1 Tax=Cladophialophora immunda TaxID=569365 RepID=A0A0D2CPS9_9EURO|nr:uncharacterized protein PV07_08731 [Cladophialophora immunda]KIW25564.1 hypothetical protein PV07_08731 [Cladophialophora immunda]
MSNAIISAIEGGTGESPQPAESQPENLVQSGTDRHLPEIDPRIGSSRSAQGYIASGFGVVAGVFAVFSFGEVPCMRQDILSKLPVVGNYWIREVPPEDNPA